MSTAFKGKSTTPGDSALEGPLRIVIIGAGLVGSSVACHLAKLGQELNKKLQINIIDIDLEGALSSSELNAGGVRATWNHPLNSELSRRSIAYFETIKSEIGFHQNGYCWMYNLDQWERAQAQFNLNRHWKALGVEYLSPVQLKQKYPFIDKIDDLGGATFSPKDGLINPNLLKLHYRRKAQAAGAEFLNRTWIAKVHCSPSPSSGTSVIHLNALQWDHLNEEELKAVLISQSTSSARAREIQIDADILVNCTGAWAKRFSGMLLGPDVKCHSFPLRRQISFFDSRNVDLSQYGMFVDPTGVYFHAEATNVLAGYAVQGEPEGYSYEYDGDAFFQEHIWPGLYERSTCFENLRHVTGWAGLYEVSEDHFPVMGKMDLSKAPPVVAKGSFYEAHSFSGRGAMQAHAAGELMAELILTGCYQSLDASALSATRFANGALLSEGLII